ncbi:FAD-binding oxidoreductase [Roseicyclus sp. F158]|uniref:FAD-binding oxidoreductase n=1 Tax=Tropicimonas omnivorans TaxID=3075590 RepID=A0ABU3DIK9_9RHOB|nr:FAD-binding oxidoreductase [Roseicyclus sp. F158]MDT0683558.1 FAD-binding oxidoreductase [Roseicyclus sp. F158]
MQKFAEIVGVANVLTDAADMAPYLTDWTGAWTGDAAAVVRPGSTDEVAALVLAAREAELPITVQSGNTSVAGGSVPGAGKPGLVLSMSRLNRIREIDSAARTATVDAGVVIEALQTATAEHGLDFPLMFGARGTAQIGGALATNAGGANVLRHGNARDLCLGIEAVLPSGEVVNGLSGLRKDNTGYDLRHLLMGSEGTLGIITGAVLKLVPTPKIRAAAFVALSEMDAALDVLNALQDATGGLVEAFEWLPRETVEAIRAHDPALRAPLEDAAETGILVELASTRPDDAATDESGEARLQSLMLATIEPLMERGLIVDGFFATSEQQRLDLWRLREAVLETIVAHGPFVALDVSLPLSAVPEVLRQAQPLAEESGLKPLLVGHLGDGNIHYAVVAAPGQTWDPETVRSFSDRLTDLVTAYGGSYSAEHGIGRAKAATLAKRKDPAQLATMRAIKAALDPESLLGRGILFSEV